MLGNWLLAAVWRSVHYLAGGGFLYRMVESADRARLGVLLTTLYWIAVGAVLLLDRGLRASRSTVANQLVAHEPEARGR